MKSLVEYLTEKLQSLNKGFEYVDMNAGSIDVSELINALSTAHGDNPTKDVVFAADDYEDYDEQVYFEYAGIDNGTIVLKFKSRDGFVNKNLYEKLIKDLDECGKKSILIDWDGMDNDDMNVLEIGSYKKADSIIIQLGKK